MVQQNSEIRLPLFIPTKTEFLKDSDTLSALRWAAADMGTLFNMKGTISHFATRQSSQKYLRVGPECNLIAVLNGKDNRLERFWEMKRGTILKQLHDSGFSIGTGATFSVTDVTEKGTPMPYFHNATMLMRHHRVVQEIQVAGMEAVPNIYWIDKDQKEIQRWAEWLMKNPGIRIVSRDFTSTRNKHTVMSKLYELVSLLNTVGRSFHVMIVGTGIKIAPLVLRELAKAGHFGSIVTSAPIQLAYRNARYRLGDNNQIFTEKCTDRSVPFSDLMRHNMEIFEQALFDAVAGTPAEHKALSNVLLSEF
ncbi:hypothetical protein BLX24_28200 [Arsenicibacter rosenii]|uniref:Uncharacterized protein n=2 Tax=Arsenicibacter rosenii TaxID=1750698 RepID=A0A1S2VBT9_9BACT|nr:hypothetical protein BLX24_28200 [Arsenicibacter rosenii]